MKIQIRSAFAVVFLCTSALSIFGAAGGRAQSEPKAANFFKGMEWRLIGPFRGGRVEAVTGIPGDPSTYYMGAVGGGVWKTTDAGVTWDSLWDKGSVSSIGAIAVAYSDPKIVYVGTGEACPRGDATYGDGMYKSTNAGKTWQHIGLTDSRHIGKILVDPHDPNRVFVAALGHVYGPNTERTCSITWETRQNHTADPFPAFDASGNPLCSCVHGKNSFAEYLASSHTFSRARHVCVPLLGRTSATSSAKS